MGLLRLARLRGLLTGTVAKPRCRRKRSHQSATRRGYLRQASEENRLDRGPPVRARCRGRPPRPLDDRPGPSTRTIDLSFVPGPPARPGHDHGGVRGADRRRSGRSPPPPEPDRGPGVVLRRRRSGRWATSRPTCPRSSGPTPPGRAPTSSTWPRELDRRGLLVDGTVQRRPARPGPDPVAATDRLGRRLRTPANVGPRRPVRPAGDPRSCRSATDRSSSSLRVDDAGLADEVADDLATPGPRRRCAASRQRSPHRRRARRSTRCSSGDRRGRSPGCTCSTARARPLRRCRHRDDMVRIVARRRGRGARTARPHGRPLLDVVGLAGDGRTGRRRPAVLLDRRRARAGPASRRHRAASTPRW